MRFMFTAFFSVFLIFASGQSRADDLSEAVGLWLDGDDRRALPALSKLAKGGDVSAQILLGRIATRPMSPWLSAMSRKARNQLLRAPGGLSGTSWLKVAEEGGSELAGLFRQALDPRAGPEVIRALAKAGETAAADEVARLLSFRSLDPAMARLVDEGAISEDARWLDWFVRAQTGHLGAEDQAALLAEAEKGRPGVLSLFGMYEKGPDWAQEYDLVFRGVPEWRSNPISRQVADAFARSPESSYPLDALRRVCADACPSEFGSCLAGGVMLVGGYHELAGLTSPTLSLLSHDKLAGSIRARRELKWSAESRLDGLGPRFSKVLKRRASCAARALSLDQE